MKKSRSVSTQFMLSVGENIAKKRKKKLLTLEQLGLEVGLTRMQIHRIEKGYNITLTTLLKIAIALDVKPESLLKINLLLKREDLENLVNESKANKRT